MFKIVAFLSLFLAAVSAQALSDIELIFEADDYAGGLPVNQTGVIRFTVINHGPDDVLTSPGAMTIVGLYNWNVSKSPIQFFSALISADPDCSLIPTSVDPPPPYIDYIPVFYGSIEKIIPAGSSVSCEFVTAIQYVDTVDMRWQIYPPYGVLDPDVNNSTQQFTFRGLAASVPVNHIFVLLSLGVMMIVSAWYYRRLNNLNSSS